MVLKRNVNAIYQQNLKQFSSCARSIAASRRESSTNRKASVTFAVRQMLQNENF
jgi:hypothetical protein